jgi:hypothetical protein
MTIMELGDVYVSHRRNPNYNARVKRNEKTI